MRTSAAGGWWVFWFWFWRYCAAGRGGLADGGSFACFFGIFLLCLKACGYETHHQSIFLNDSNKQTSNETFFVIGHCIGDKHTTGVLTVDDDEQRDGADKHTHTHTHTHRVGRRFLFSLLFRFLFFDYCRDGGNQGGCTFGGGGGDCGSPSHSSSSLSGSSWGSQPG